MDVFGFIRNTNCNSGAWEALVIEREDVTFAKMEKLRAQGWELVIDNVSTEAAAYEAMEVGVINEALQEVRAHRRTCGCCGWLMPGSALERVVGRRRSHRQERVVVFNGYVCGQCLQEFESVKYKGVMVTPHEKDLFEQRAWAHKLKTEGAHRV